MLCFNFLAFHTPSDVFCNFSFHTWSNVLALDRCYGFLISRVPCIRSIMHLMQNYTFQILDIWYKFFFLVQQYSIYSQLINIHLPKYLTLLQHCYQFSVLQIYICSLHNFAFNISLIHVDGCSMKLMHPPAECIKHFILFPFDMIYIKVIFSQKF